MLTVVGTEVLVSTQAAQITKNIKLMRLTQFWIRQTKEKQSTKGKKQWPIYKQRKKRGKDGVTCQLLICIFNFFYVYIFLLMIPMIKIQNKLLGSFHKLYCA